MGYDDNSGTDVTTATGVLVMAGRDAGDTTVFNDATFAVNTDGDLEALAYDGAIPTANTITTVGTLTYIDDDNEEFLAGGSPTITTTGKCINRVDTVATPSLGTEDFTAGDVISVGANSLSHTLTAGEVILQCRDRSTKIAHTCQMQHQMLRKLTFSGGNDLA